MIFEAVLILVGFFAANDRTSERLWLFMGAQIICGIRQACCELLLADTTCNLAVWTILTRAQSLVNLLLSIPRLPGLKQTLGRFVNAQIDHVIAHAETEVVPKTIHIVEHQIILHRHVIHACEKILVNFAGRAWR